MELQIYRALCQRPYLAFVAVLSNAVPNRMIENRFYLTPSKTRSLLRTIYSQARDDSDRKFHDAAVQKFYVFSQYLC